MKRCQVFFAPEAVKDLEAIYDLIAAASSPTRALAYLDRLESYCLGFDIASERGRARDDIRKGLRITSFDRRITIAFSVSPDQITFLRLFYAGSDWESALEED